MQKRWRRVTAGTIAVMTSAAGSVAAADPSPAVRHQTSHRVAAAAAACSTESYLPDVGPRAVGGA
jgi:hypothetical protein